MSDKYRKALLADDRPLKGAHVESGILAQPNLLLDPLPARVEPALALLKSKPPSDPRSIPEIKFDGFRGAIHIEPGGVRFFTRGGHD